MKTMDAVKMMVRGQVGLTPVVRGMAVVGSDGAVVGMVAAVLWDGDQQRVTQLLLCQLPTTAVYRQIPLSVIDHMSETAVYLTIPAAELLHLLPYEPANPT